MEQFTHLNIYKHAQKSVERPNSVITLKTLVEKWVKDFKRLTELNITSDEAKSLKENIDQMRNSFSDIEDTSHPTLIRANDVLTKFQQYLSKVIESDKISNGKYIKVDLFDEKYM